MQRSLVLVDHIDRRCSRRPGKEVLALIIGIVPWLTPKLRAEDVGGVAAGHREIG